MGQPAHQVGPVPSRQQALEPEHELVGRVAWVVGLLGRDDQCARLEACPGNEPDVGVELVAGKPGDIADNHCRHAPLLEQPNHTQHAQATRDRLAAHSEVVVDHQDVLGGKAEPLGDLGELVLLLRGHHVVADLAEAALAQVNYRDLRQVEPTRLAHVSPSTPAVSPSSTSISAGAITAHVTRPTSCGRSLLGAMQTSPRGLRRRSGRRERDGIPYAFASPVAIASYSVAAAWSASIVRRFFWSAASWNGW